MEKEILKVKRDGEFYYPIYFKNNFNDLADAIKEEGLADRIPLYCY